MYTKFAVILLCNIASIQSRTVTTKEFPNGFLLGVATAAYQIEGAWNISGKGENNWDRLTHQRPEMILDRSNGDIACNSYYKIKEDVALLKNLGVDFYRFSLSWSRILPTGFVDRINPDGIRYYNELINELLKNNIKPMITLFHWDTPQPIENLGGFTNSLIVNLFEDYANVAFTNFGDRVTEWITFNEPHQTCMEGYGRTTKAPALNFSGVADYLCAHNILKAHGKVYHLYKNNYKSSQKGRIGIALDTLWYEPATNSTKDVEAAEREMQFRFGVFANPIFSKYGDYPTIMKKFVDARSKAEGFSRSRLPKFTSDEIKYIQGTYDFFGLNHYTTRIVADAVPSPVGDPSLEKDIRAVVSVDPNWSSSSATWLKVVPWGFRKVLNWIKTTYDNPEIVVTENGYSDKGELDDQARINYYKSYLSEMLDAINDDGVNIGAYTAWSLIDNFEWMDGYVNRFGLHHVDFSNPDRPRTMKSSAKFYKELVAKRSLVVENKLLEK